MPFTYNMCTNTWVQTPGEGRYILDDLIWGDDEDQVQCTNIQLVLDDDYESSDEEEPETPPPRPRVRVATTREQRALSTRSEILSILRRPSRVKRTLSL
jgi:hypothetical protein